PDARTGRRRSRAPAPGRSVRLPTTAATGPGACWTVRSSGGPPFRIARAAVPPAAWPWWSCPRRSGLPPRRTSRSCRRPPDLRQPFAAAGTGALLPVSLPDVAAVRDDRGRTALAAHPVHPARAALHVRPHRVAAAEVVGIERRANLVLEDVAGQELRV